MNIIRQMRREAGLTQKDLASRAGTSQATIAAYETHKKSPTLRTIHKIAESLDLELVMSHVPKLTREDRRSLAFHRVVVEKLLEDSSTVIARARKNLRKLQEMHPHAQPLLGRWRKWLELPPEDIVARMLDQDLGAREMRQVSPFAGLLTAQERAMVIRSFRQEMAL